MVIDNKSPDNTAGQSDTEMKKLNMLGQLAFGMIHDIRNSLQILRASSMMIRKHASDEKLSRYIDDIDSVVENTSQMAERVLSFSNKPDTLISEIDLRASLDETISLSQYILPAHINIRYKRPEHAMTLMGNEVELSRALLNLIKNASEAIEPMQGRGFIDLSLRACFPWIELKIRDSGCGIAPDQLEKVFEPLYTTKADGTGIGLANVRATVESHGGVISVSSELGKGSEFTIMIPGKNA